ARSGRQPREALGWAQLLAAGGIAWTAYMIADSLPYWPINPLLSSSVWFNFQVDLMRTFWAVLPPALLWGASFPLAMAAVAGPNRDPARVAGETYAANTVGAILGAVLFSVLFVPWLQTQNAQRLLMGLATVAALLALMPILRMSEKRTAGAVIVILSLGGVISLMRGLP